jgi:hypothetical protein
MTTSIPVMVHERRETRVGWNSGATRRLTGSQAKSRLLELNADLFMRLKEMARERFGLPDYDPVVEVAAIGLDPTCDADTRLRAHAYVGKFIYTQRAQLDVNLRSDDDERAPFDPVQVADAIVGRLESVARERRAAEPARASEERATAGREGGLGVTPVQKTGATNGSGR